METATLPALGPWCARKIKGVWCVARCDDTECVVSLTPQKRGDAADQAHAEHVADVLNRLHTS